MKKISSIEKERKEKMIAFTEVTLKNIKVMIKRAKKDDACIVLHQDSFAADYQDSEYILLGNMIKYIGEYGVEVRIVGKNRETLK